MTDPTMPKVPSAAILKITDPRHYKGCIYQGIRNALIAEQMATPEPQEYEPQVPKSMTMNEDEVKAAVRAIDVTMSVMLKEENLRLEARCRRLELHILALSFATLALCAGIAFRHLF